MVDLYFFLYVNTVHHHLEMFLICKISDVGSHAGPELSNVLASQKICFHEVKMCGCSFQERNASERKQVVHDQVTDLVYIVLSMLFTNEFKL